MTPPIFLRTLASTALVTALGTTAPAIAQKAPNRSAPSTLGNDMIVPLVQTPDAKATGKQSDGKAPSSLNDGLDELVTPLDGTPVKGKTKSVDAAMDGLDELVTPLDGLDELVTPLDGKPDQAKGKSVDAAMDGLDELVTPLDGLDELVTPLDGAMSAEQVKKVADEKIRKQRAAIERRNAEEARRYEIDVAEYERQLAEAERLRRLRDKNRTDREGPKTIIIERKYMDDCADFIVRWSGEKVCQARMKTKMEIVSSDDKDKDKEKNRDNNPPKDYANNTPGGLAPFGGDGASAGGGAGGSSGGGGGGSFGGGGGGGRGGAGGGGAASGADGHGSVAGTSMPDAKGFRAIGPYTVRIDGTRRHANGDVDVNVTFATPTSARLLIGNGDWRVLATDEDGVSTDSIAIYREGSGPLVAFDQMPYVSATAPSRARFRVLAVAGMSTIRSITILYAGMSRITLPVDPLGPSTGEAVAESSATPGRLKWFEVRYDALKTVGRTTELSFSARNVTDTLQYAGGTRLQFIGAGANGKPIDNSGRVYAVRGTLGRQLDGVSVVPGQWGRFRVVFDAPGVHGPITVKDGATTATPPVPAAAAAAEPAW